MPNFSVQRYAVINHLLRGRDQPTYLEIGLATGDTWFRVRAAHKIGVDPRDVFKAPKVSWPRTLLFELSRIAGAEFFAMSSDEFFARQAEGVFRRRRLDVAFIDGWHSYEQSLRDTLQCLRYLKDDGVIVIHDCNPQSAAATAATPEEALRLSNHTSGWNGDVWKTVVHLRAVRSDLDVCVLDCDEGLGLVRFGPPRTSLTLSIPDIQALTFDDLARQRALFLNLKDPALLPEVIGDPQDG